MTTRRQLALSALLSSVPALSQAAPVNAITNNGDWIAAGTWSDDAVPSAANDYFVPSGIGIDGFIGGSTGGNPTRAFGGGSLTIQSGGSLYLDSNHSLSYPDWTYGISNLTLENGSSLHVRGGAGTDFFLTNGFTVAANATVAIRHSAGSYDQRFRLGPVSGPSTAVIQLLGTHNPSNGSINAKDNYATVANSSYAGNWLLDYTVTAANKNVRLRADAANALGTGIVTLERQSLLENNASGGFDSLSGIALNQASSTVNFGSHGWTNPAATLTITNGTANIGTGTVSIASMSQAAGSTNLNVGGAASGKIAVSGNADLSGTTIGLTVGGNPAGNTYDLVTYGGTLTGTPVLSPLFDAGRLAANLSPGSGTNDKVTVSFTGTVGSLVWKGSDAVSPNAWDNNTTQNFTNGGSPDVFRLFDNVLFDGTASSFTPAITGSLSAGTVTFSGATDYTLSGPGSLGGSTSLVKSGTHSLTVSTANTFTGPVTISEGTLKAGVVGALGAAGGSTLVNGGILDINALTLSRTGVTLAGGKILNSSATQQQQAFTTLTVTGNSAIGGTGRWDVRGATAVTTVNAGATLTKEDANLIYLGVNGSVVNDGIIESTNGIAAIYAGTITGTGSFVASGTGTVAIEQGTNNPLPVTLAGGTFGMAAGSSATQTGNVTLTADSSIRGTGSAAFPINGDVTESGGSYGVTVPATGGSLSFNGATTFTGGLSMGGTAATATTVTLGSISILGVASGKQIAVGNTAASGTANQTLNIDGTVNNSGTLRIGRPGIINVRSGASWNQSGDATVEGVGGYTATLNVNGSANLTYNSPNSFKINGAAASSGQGRLNLDGIFTTSSGFEQTTVPTTGYGRVTMNGGTLKLSSNVPQLTTQVQWVLSGGGGTFDTNGFNAAISGVSTVGSGGALTSGISGNGSLTKIGAGRLTLTGANSYTGNTWLDVGTLAGTGATGSFVTVASGTTLAPGASIGTFNCAGANFESGSALAIEIDSTSDSADKLNSTGGDINITGASVSFTEIGTGIIPAGTKLALIDYTGRTLTGTFNGRAEGSTVTVGSNTFVLSYVDSSMVTLTSTTVGSAYDTWASANGIPGQPFDGDFDKDGTPNGLEWILGGDPDANDPAPLVTTTGNATNGLTLVFGRNPDSIGVANLAVDWDIDLDAFAHSLTIGTVDVGPGGNNPTIDIDAPAARKVTVNIPAANAIGGKLFARLRATLP